MTVQIDTTAEIDAVRLKTEGSHPSAPSSGHILLYFVTGTAVPGLYTELSNGQKIGPFITGSSGGGGGGSALLYKSATRIDIVNSTTLTDLINYTIPGGTLGSSNALRGTIKARTVHGVAGTFTIVLNYGGSSLTITLTEGAVVTDKSTYIHFFIQAAGVTNAQRINMEAFMEDRQGSASNIGTGPTGRFNQDITTSADSTTNQVLQITGQWNTNSNSLDYDQSWAGIELLA